METFGKILLFAFLLLLVLMLLVYNKGFATDTNALTAGETGLAGSIHPPKSYPTGS